LIAVMSAGPNGNGHGRANGTANGAANGAANTVANGAQTASVAPSIAMSPDSAASAPAATDEDERASDEQQVAPVSDENVEQARFIGNIRTMVYHDVDADGLPAEENRIFFPSEADALEAGYHRDRDEVSPPTESGTPSGNVGTA
ncbi:MAG: hypothetical protein ACRDHE_09240, partial [Ktedonobacterales bacterium]